MSPQDISFTVNGVAHTVSAWPMERLLDVLRNKVGLTGTKEGCGEGECGSCSVLMNDQLVNSCLVPVLHAHGASLCTIEGVAAADGGLHAVQQAFLKCGGAQCGICTPGMVLASVQLLKRNPSPNLEQVREGLGGNLCRCTGYTRIFDAVLTAAKVESTKGMRSQPSQYELVAPANLKGVLELMAREPGAWMPIAGGTELMVQYGAGRLAARKLVSLWGLPELRRIEQGAEELLIGAACTYSDLRNHAQVAAEFPLLARAASWTGSVANQNRGTLGGNIVNASPAADSLPALLVYEAELLLVSARGERRMPYAQFHTGYKKTALAADEIIAAILLRPQFAGYYAYSRKVGTRNAQAIAKLCLAGLGKLAENKIEDVRLAIGSMAVTPLRLAKTELALRGRPWTRTLIADARRALEAEVAPIDDIRSTAAYRLQVAGNLLEQFIEDLFAGRPQ